MNPLGEDPTLSPKTVFWAFDEVVFGRPRGRLVRKKDRKAEWPGVQALIQHHFVREKPIYDEI